MLWKIVLALGALIIVLLVVVAMQPAEFRIERSTKIVAQPADIFAQVNDFHNWPAWSPWEKLDPDMKRSYSGPVAGPGSVYEWSGNDKARQGRMTITDSRRGDLVQIKLDFIKPFESTATVEFAFKPEGGGTNVNWSMTGHNNFMAKGAGLFMNIDKMVGGDFEKGLAQLKTTVEAAKK